MPLSTNINTYADIAAVLEQVPEGGKATYTLPSPGKARHWSQRAYKYRILLQKENATKNKGFIPPTRYDRMKLIVHGPDVHIDLNPFVEGSLKLPTGEIIRPQVTALPRTAPADTPLLDLALQLANRLDDEN